MANSLAFPRIEHTCRRLVSMGGRGRGDPVQTTQPSWRLSLIGGMQYARARRGPVRTPDNTAFLDASVCLWGELALAQLGIHAGTWCVMPDGSRGWLLWRKMLWEVGTQVLLVRHSWPKIWTQKLQDAKMYICEWKDSQKDFKINERISLHMHTTRSTRLAGGFLGSSLTKTGLKVVVVVQQP